MAIRLHHAFVLTGDRVPDVDCLVDIGMTEGSANTHPGQGTANRRFFFADFGLELIYFTDVDEARNGPGRVIRSRDRFEAADGSPFGLVFRSDADADVDSFAGFPYQPIYFEQGQYFLIGDNADLLGEPNCVLMPANLPNRPPQKLCPAPYESLSRLRLYSPVKNLSPVLAAAAAIERVEVMAGHENLMELEFGAGKLRRLHDLRPQLPLVVRC